MNLKGSRYGIKSFVSWSYSSFSFSWGCFSFMCRVWHINDINTRMCLFILSSDDFLFKLRCRFNKFAGHVASHTIMLEVLKPNKRICRRIRRRAWLPIFVEVCEEDFGKKDCYWIKIHKIEAQASQIQVIHVLQYLFTRHSLE